MTDNEIIKALLCHESWSAGCDSCPLTMGKACGMVLARGALDIINRQSVEIERYEKENTVLVENNHILATEYAKKAKAEAIKEFAERLCADRVSNDPVVIAATCLLKEMSKTKESETE